jgi:anti-sigma factor RsiW
MLLTCHWSARRIQRYLDADPSAPLSPGEVRRLESHLARCDRCATLSQDYQYLNRALARFSGQRLPDRAAVERMHAVIDQLVQGRR